MDIEGGGWPDEYEFFEAAIANPTIKGEYRKFIESIALEEVARVIAQDGNITTNAEGLLRAAMEPFERAVEKYRRHNDDCPHDYPFSQYYRWWARQYATAFLHSSRIP